MTNDWTEEPHQTITNKNKKSPLFICEDIVSGKKYKYYRDKITLVRECKTHNTMIYNPKNIENEIFKDNIMLHKEGEHENITLYIHNEHMKHTTIYNNIHKIKTLFDSALNNYHKTINRKLFQIFTINHFFADFRDNELFFEIKHKGGRHFEIKGNDKNAFLEYIYNHHMTQHDSLKDLKLIKHTTHYKSWKEVDEHLSMICDNMMSYLSTHISSLLKNENEHRKNKP